MSTQGLVNIGANISIKGEIHGDEDLVVEGKIEGTIDLQNHALHLGPKCHVSAEIRAKTVTVEGQVDGDIYSSERLEIRKSGRVTGNIVTPRLALEDGARLKGSVDMDRDTGDQKAPERIQAQGLSQATAPKQPPSKR